MTSSRSLFLPFLVTLLLVGAAGAQCGDCDLGGSSNILDALLAAHHAAGISQLNGQAFTQCDVDACGTVDILDALAIAQAAAGPVVNPCSVGGCAVVGSCGAPIQLTSGAPYFGSNASASDRELTACGSLLAFAPDQVHEISFTGTGTIRVELSATFSACVEVRTVGCGASLGCLSGTGILEVPAQPGGTYSIIVDGDAGGLSGMGNYTLTVTIQ